MRNARKLDELAQRSGTSNTTVLRAIDEEFNRMTPPLGAIPTHSTKPLSAGDALG